MTRLGYVVVELVHGTQKPQARSTLFAWDGGEVHDTIEDAQAAADDANSVIGWTPDETPSDGDLVYKVAEVTLIPQDPAS